MLNSDSKDLVYTILTFCPAIRTWESPGSDFFCYHPFQSFKSLF
ncbi:hypothetical protein P059_02325 [Chlamydia psittaci UGA]|nr:hypothetical protein GWI_02315 [Chlamydia psittaci str. Frances]KXH24830.1 hypothetical protein P059_02325 [Chlamydia psittaci UGA]